MVWRLLAWAVSPVWCYGTPILLRITIAALRAWGWALVQWLGAFNARGYAAQPNTLPADARVVCRMAKANG